MAATHLVESSAVLHRLAPGLRVVARGRDRLQVGMYAERRLVLARTPDVERVLQALVELQPLDTASDPAAAEVLAQLDRAGVLLSGRSSTAPPASPVAVVGCLPGVDGPGVLVQAGLTLVTNLEQAATVVVLSPGELARELLDPLLRRGIEHVVVRLVDGGAKTAVRATLNVGAIDLTGGIEVATPGEARSLLALKDREGAALGG